MSNSAGASGATHGAMWPTNWALWQRPSRWVGFSLFHEVFVVVLVVGALLAVPPDAGEILPFALLALLGMAQAEASRRIERIRRRLSHTPHISMTAVWLVPGAIVLSPGLAAVLGAVLYLHLGVRIWQPLRNIVPCRIIAGASVNILSSLTASAVIGGFAGERPLTELSPLAAAVAITLAAAAFETVNALVTALALFFAAVETVTAATVFGSWRDNALEFATVGLGVLTSLSLLYQPYLLVFTLLPLLVLERSVLVKQLEVAATTDEKTGLLNAVTWHNLGKQELSQASRGGTTVGVLMVDLDHFKRINDTYGHLAGDAVLKDVADLLKKEVRDYDSVGRFGGEEFVVLLPGIDPAGATATAERIRAAVAGLAVEAPVSAATVIIDNLSASLGIAVYPEAGEDLEQLLMAADMALYQAKNSGRNRVVSSADLAS